MLHLNPESFKKNQNLKSRNDTLDIQLIYTHLFFYTNIYKATDFSQFRGNHHTTKCLK